MSQPKDTEDGWHRPSTCDLEVVQNVQTEDWEARGGLGNNAGCWEGALTDPSAILYPGAGSGLFNQGVCPLQSEWPAPPAHAQAAGKALPRTRRDGCELRLFQSCSFGCSR